MQWKEVWRNRIVTPIKTLLKTGVTPERISLSIATGTVIGIFPVLGTTTALCVALSLSLRLNIVAMQAFNWLVAGTQLLLILPFIRLGERIFGAPPLPLAPVEVQALFDPGIVHAFRQLGWSIVHAVSAWTLVAPFLFGVTYVLALWCTVRLREARASTAVSAEPFIRRKDLP